MATFQNGDSNSPCIPSLLAVKPRVLDRPQDRCPIPGVTSLSPATAEVHALREQQGTSNSYGSTSQRRIVPRAVEGRPRAPAPPYACNDGLRSVHRMPGQLCEELRRCSLRQAKSHQARKGRPVHWSQCTHLHSWRLQPSSSNSAAPHAAFPSQRCSLPVRVAAVASLSDVVSVL